MDQRLNTKKFLIKLIGNSYSINQSGTNLKQFPMDQQALQYLNENQIKSYQWIQSLRMWMRTITVDTIRFTRITTNTIMGIFLFTVLGIVLSYFFEISWLSDVFLGVGIAATFIFTIIAIIKLKRKVGEIRVELTYAIQSAEMNHKVNVEEVYLQGCPCCQPVLPAALRIYKDFE